MRASQPRGRVLLVETDPLVIASCQHVFERLELDVREARDVAAARRLLKEESFDVVVADESAWALTGVNMLTTALHKQPYARRILVTTTMDALTLDRALGVAKVDGILKKPMSERDLEDVLVVLFRGALMRRPTSVEVSEGAT